MKVKVSRHRRKPVRDGKLESTQQVGMSEYLSLCVAGDVGSVVIKENHIFFF